jgi:hypothetical protein
VQSHQLDVMHWKCPEVPRRMEKRLVQAEAAFTVRVSCLDALLCVEQTSHRCCKMRDATVLPRE